MVNTPQEFTQSLLTYRDISQATNWPAVLVDDYISFKNDLLLVADNGDTLTGRVNTNTAEIANINQFVASLIAENAQLRTRLNEQIRQQTETSRNLEQLAVMVWL